MAVTMFGMTGYEIREFSRITNASHNVVYAIIKDCEKYESTLMKEAQPAIAYYTARLLQDEIRDPQTNNKKGARL